MSGPPVSVLDQAAIARAATGRRFGARFELHADLASTNDRAKALAAEGAPEGTLVVATRQTGGRGRLGRVWSSPPGGLYLSLLLRPSEDVLRRAPLSLAAGLAASEALDVTGRVATNLKWPNDVLLAGKKIGGILAEVVSASKGEAALVLGIGLNVDTPLEAFEPEVRELATSLRAFRGKPASLEEALKHLLSHLEGHYESAKKGGALLLSRAADRMSFLGSRIRVRLADRVLEGKAAGLTATGALVVETDAGTRETVYAGDVEQVRLA